MVIASQTQPSQRLTALHVFAAFVCAVALAVDMIEIAIGNALATVFSAAPYSIPADRLSWLLAAVYLGAIVGAPLFGWASDRRGIRFCLTVALLWLGLTSSLAAFSPTTGWLAAMRFLSGLSLGAVPPLLIAYLTHIAPPRYRGVFIFWVCGIAALAPPLALFAVRWLLPLQPFGVEGWRWPLAIAGVLSAMAAWSFSRLPEVNSWPGATLRDQSPIATQSVQALPSFQAHGRRFTFVACIYFLLPWASVGFPLLTGPILLVRGYDLSDALLYATMTTLGPTVGSLVTGLFVDRIERRTALAGCAVVMAIAVVVFWLSSSRPWLATALVTFGVATAIYVTVLTIYAAEIFPAGIRTFATSTAWAINRGASVIAPVILFPLVASHSAAASMLPICVALGASIILIVTVGPNGAAGRALS